VKENGKESSEIKRIEGKFYTSIHENLPNLDFEIIKMNRKDRIKQELDSFNKL